jgi:hypothetical protein
MWKRFLSLSRIQQIAAVVCIAHAVAVFALSVHHLATRQLRPSKPIAVRTRAALPSPTGPKPQVFAPKNVGYKKTTASKSQAPKKTPETKPSPPKSQPVKEKAIAKKPAPQKEAAVKPQQDLANLAESLQALSSQTEKSPSRPSLDLPPVLSKMAPERETKITEEPDSQPSYEQFLIAYLQSSLELPEYGDVKIEIQIDRFGNPLHCAVLESRSAKNGEFLKKRLPELSFPCFNDFGITDLTLTFTIAFRNVEVH